LEKKRRGQKYHYKWSLAPQRQSVGRWIELPGGQGPEGRNIRGITTLMEQAKSFEDGIIPRRNGVKSASRRPGLSKGGALEPNKYYKCL